MGQGQGIAPEAPNGGPQARWGICCTRHLVQLVDKCLARTSRSHYLLRFRGEGQHKPVPDGCSPVMSRKGRKCYVCCPLLLRPPGPSWAAVMSNSVSATAAKRTAATSRAKSRPTASAARQGTPEETSRPCRFSQPADDPSDSRCRLARTSRAAISTWGSCWYLQATRPIPPQKRPSDGYAPG
jgi:hypothetical protein